MLSNSIRRIGKNRLHRLTESRQVLYSSSPPSVAVAIHGDYDYSEKSPSLPTHRLSSSRSFSSCIDDTTSKIYAGHRQQQRQGRHDEIPSLLLDGSSNVILSRATTDVDSCTTLNNPSFYKTLHNITHRAFSTSSSTQHYCGGGRNTNPGQNINSIDLLSRSFLMGLNSTMFDNNHHVSTRRQLYAQYRSFSTTPPPPSSSSKPKPISSTAATPTTEPVTASFSTNAYSSSTNVAYYSDKIKDITARVSRAMTSFIMATPGVLWFYLTHPKEFRQKMIDLKEAAKKEAHHYWMGSKLLAADVSTARQLVGRTLQGSSLTRRERKQLLRTVTDLFRLVPMSMFVLIPFMEFALPFALKIFPNMLPSTFQDSLKAEEDMKRELQSRIAMAGFFQETLQGLAKEQKRRATKNKAEAIESAKCDGTYTKREETAESFLEFLEKSRSGEVMPPDVIIRYAKYFQDDLTLDNMSRMQLINMCKYMGIPPYGADSLLRFQLRHRNRVLKEDDQRILWEGIESLTKMELREACQERGMRSIGLSKNAYQMALQQWLDLSVNKDVPISILIMSRTFFLREEMEAPIESGKTEDTSLKGIADAISGLEKEIVNEVVLDVASKSMEDYKNSDLVAIKLEVLEQQNELIEEEYKEREMAKKKKEENAAATKEQMDEEAASAAGSENVNESSESTTATITTTSENIVSFDDEKVQVTASEEEIAGISSEDKVTAAVDNAKDTTEESDTFIDSKGKEEEEDDDDETELSAEELDAISQLLSPNAVQAEREDLDLIKAAIAADDEAVDEGDEETRTSDATLTNIELDYVAPLDTQADITSPLSSDGETQQLTAEEMDERVAQTITDQDADVAKEANDSTSIDTGSFSATEEQPPAMEEELLEDTKLDASIARLKSKVETMVGKIELQMADVEAKIGDKMHLLDKDNDGILTNEELAQVLQEVLKRDLTLEDAMAIASDMDENEDGFLTVSELGRWMETNKLVKLVEEGRDAEVDYAIEKKAAKLKEKQKIDSLGNNGEHQESEISSDEWVEEKKG